jgi:hypothetical protein
VDATVGVGVGETRFGAGDPVPPQRRWPVTSPVVMWVNVIVTGISPLLEALLSRPANRRDPQPG